MAAGIFAVFDDVAVLMDDVATASKIATRKTAGILGDDLAVNAEKATGFLAKREIPVLWSITKGSFINKLIIIPVALLLSALWPVAITGILIAGGCYLAYEGVESILHFLFRRVKTDKTAAADQIEMDAPNEKVRIRSAITTDLVLSAEIVIIALGTVLGQPLSIQIFTVSVVAVLATVGVYGFVALIVRMDDFGYRLLKFSNEKGFVATLGHVLLWLMPVIIKLLRIVGTAALLLVSGGIFIHNIDYLHHVFPDLLPIVKEVVAGLAVGLVATGAVEGIRALVRLMRGGIASH